MPEKHGLNGEVGSFVAATWYGVIRPAFGAAGVSEWVASHVFLRCSNPRTDTSSSRNNSIYISCQGHGFW